MRIAITIAWKMIKEKRQRAFLLALSTTIAACLLFTSYYFIHSLNNSSLALSDRLGADLIIVPKGMGAYAAENALRGAVSKLYFDEEKARTVLASITDIQSVAPQLYLETVSTSCCGTIGDFPIVAFDPATDFTLKAWMPGAQELAKDEIVIGVDAGGERFLYHYNDPYIKEKVMLFSQPFFVKNALFPTGTGADNTIFMHIERARELIKEVPVLKHMHQTHISVLFIETTPHSELFVKQQIEEKLPDVDVVLGSGLKEQMKKQIMPIKLLSYVMIVTALIITLLQVATLFSALVKERQKEIGVLLALGVTKRHVYKLLLWEAALISFIGTFFGVLLSLSILYDRQTLLYFIFQLPLVFPKLGTSVMIGIGAMLTITTCTLLAATLPIQAFVQREPYDVVREGDV